MKKAIIVLVLVVAGSFALFYLYGASVNDKAVKFQETVDEAWGNVQAAYQRRADLIPNLVNTVKGAAENEKEILIQVTEARAGIGAAKTPGEIDVHGATINRAISVIFERYPEVKATQNFAMLQTQLEGTENRINTERTRYNETIKEFNTHVRGFWRSKALSLIGKAEEFPKREPFKATEGSEDAPVVNFSNEKTTEGTTTTADTAAVK